MRHTMRPFGNAPHARPRRILRSPQPLKLQAAQAQIAEWDDWYARTFPAEESPEDDGTGGYVTGEEEEGEADGLSPDGVVPLFRLLPPPAESSIVVHQPPGLVAEDLNAATGNALNLSKAYAKAGGSGTA